MPAGLRTTRILWFALFASTFGYAVVLAVVQTPPPPTDPTVFFGIAFAGMSTAGASAFVSRMLFRSAALRSAPAIREEPDASQVQYRDVVPMRRVFAEPDAARRAAILAHRAPFIVGMALEGRRRSGIGARPPGLPAVTHRPLLRRVLDPDGVAVPARLGDRARVREDPPREVLIASPS